MLVVFELLKSHASVYFFVLSSILSCEKQGFMNLDFGGRTILSTVLEEI